MTDIVLLFCTTIGGFLLGRYIQRAQQSKAQFFVELSRYVSLFKINVQGRQLTLADFNSEFVKNCSQSLAQYLLENKLPYKFNKSQEKIIVDFFSSLSQSGSSELAKNLEYYEQLIMQERDSLTKQAKDGLVNLKLGALLGVMLGILLV